MLTRKLFVLNLIFLLWIGGKLFGQVIPNPLLSSGKTVYASPSTNKQLLTDGVIKAGNQWYASAGSWWAINVGSGPDSVMINFNTDCINWANIEDNSNGYDQYVNYPVSYRLLTSANSTNGENGDWTPVLTISGNIWSSRTHTLPFTGKSWVKMVINGVVGGSYSDYARFSEVEIFDITNSKDDSWFFIGNSITAMTFRTFNVGDDAFEKKVAEGTGNRPMVLRGGISGIGAEHLVDNWDDYYNNAKDAKYWAIMVGTNNAWGGYNNYVAAYKANMQTFIDYAKSKNKIVILAQIPATKESVRGWQIHPDFIAAVEELQNQEGVIAGPDFYTWFLNHPEAINDESFGSPDGVHPTNAGADSIQRLWAEFALEKIYTKGPIISNFTVDPNVVKNTMNNTITFSATVTNNEGTLTSVTLDLTAIGGGAAVAMAKSGNEYTSTYNLASGAAAGTKTIPITAVNSGGYETTKNVLLEVVDPALVTPVISNFTVSPLNIGIDNSKEITLSATVTDILGTVESVIVNLSAVGGGTNVAMTKSGDNYSASYTVDAGQTEGPKTISLTAKSAGALSSTATVTLQVKDIPEGSLYTEGNKIKYSDGSDFMGRGVNIFTGRSCSAWNALSTSQVLAQIDDVTENWGANFLRLCMVNNDAVVEYDPTVTEGDILTDLEYQQQLIDIAEHVEKMPGVYIIFDLWWEQHIDKNDGVPESQYLPYLIQTWEKLTELLSPYSHVLFGIVNEPVANQPGWGQFDFDEAYVWNVMNEVAKAIRAKEEALNSSKHIILAQGTEKFGRPVNYYVNHPLVYGNGDNIENIVYETHPYDHPADWNNIFLNAAKEIPVIIGEFGPAIVNGDQYMFDYEAKELMELADEKGIPWTAWSYHSACGDVNNMLNGDGSLTDWGSMVKNHLLGNQEPKITNFTSSTDKIYNHVDTEISFSATVTIEGGKTISSATLDLSEIGGGSTVAMTQNGDQYTKDYTVNAGTVTTGVKTIRLTATDSEGITKIATVNITVSKLATSNLIIYNDNNTLITDKGESFGSLIETQDNGAYEGKKHYAFNYDYTQNWASFDLVLDNRSGLDFSGYESIQLACKITGASLPDIQLIDNNWAFSNKVNIPEANGEYKVFTVPLSSFSGVDLSRIYDMQILLGGQGTETGTLYVDDIRLISSNNATHTNEMTENINKSFSHNQPNPFSDLTTICFNVTANEHYSLKIFDLNGRELITLLERTLPPGNYSIDWNGKDANNNQLRDGIYFYILQSGNGFIETRKMILTKN